MKCSFFTQLLTANQHWQQIMKPTGIVAPEKLWLVMLQVCAVIARGDHPQILGTLRQKDASLRTWVQMEGGTKRGTLIRSADIFCVLL